MSEQGECIVHLVISCILTHLMSLQRGDQLNRVHPVYTLIQLRLATVRLLSPYITHCLPLNMAHRQLALTVGRDTAYPDRPAAPLCLSIRHYRRCRQENSGFVSSALRAFEPESKEGEFTCCPHLRVLSTVSSSSQYAHFPLAALRTAVVVRSCTHPHRAHR